MATNSRRTDTAFTSGEETCAAWWYHPEAPGPHATIVMAHGLGGVRQMRLDAFAERFVEAGYACLVFDYRHFGASGGSPRQILDIRRQLEDWRAAIAHVRTLAEVDADRIVVWGTSFGGGHAIVTGADDPEVAAVIAQCPFTDGLASTVATPTAISLRLTALGVLDRAGSVIGRAPVTVPSYGDPGEVALMSSPDSRPGMEALMPEDPVRNDIAARFALDIVRHFPGRRSPDLACPTLFVVCESDAVAPAGATQRHAARAPQGEVVTFPVGHFDIYVGEAFETNVAAQLDFLARHVPADT